jgi:membrane fusion protein (multidrug efflux system)
VPEAIPHSDAAALSLAEKRKKYFRYFAIILLIFGLASLFWWVFFGDLTQSTDDAYVGGDSAAITPLVSGAVKAVTVSDTQHVHKGDALVEIDDADAQVAAMQADAELQRVTRKVRGYVATDTGLAAQEIARRAASARAHAQVDQARTAYDKAQADLGRRTSIASDGAVSGEEVATARAAVNNAKANLDSAYAAYQEARANQHVAAGNLATNHALVSGSSIDANPEVGIARAKLNQAQLDLSRTILRAPFDGVIARRQVQIGQRVQAGSVLMSVVPLNALFVDANFKENQLKKMRMGQSVTLTSDRYGSGVTFHGKVTGFAGGTGSAFAIIPAQNATGNWIKVVQRVPVRITLDPADIAAHPLLVGLSMSVTVDVSH